MGLFWSAAAGLRDGGGGGAAGLQMPGGQAALIHYFHSCIRMGLLFPQWEELVFIFPFWLLPWPLLDGPARPLW